jgi:hypothetical protein
LFVVPVSVSSLLSQPSPSTRNWMFANIFCVMTMSLAQLASPTTTARNSLSPDPWLTAAASSYDLRGSLDWFS